MPASRATITLPIGTSLVSYPGPGRLADSERDPLSATALVLDNGRDRVAILNCDLMNIHPTVVEDVREITYRLTGIAPDHLMICSSHTHSGPPSFARPTTRPGDRAYVARLPSMLAGAVAAAARGLQLVRLSQGSASAAVGVNRRERRADGRVVLGHNPDGPVDYMVRVITLDVTDGRPMTVLVNYACHPVVLGQESLAISANYVGAMRAVVERTTDSKVLFMQGACADINPRLGPGADQRQVQSLGAELAGAVLTAYAETTPVRGDTLERATARIALSLLEDTSGVPNLLPAEKRAALHCREGDPTAMG